MAHTNHLQLNCALLQKIKKKENLKRAYKTEGETTEVTGRENTKKEKSQARKKKTLEFVLVWIAKEMGQNCPNRNDWYQEKQASFSGEIYWCRLGDK